MNNQRVVLELPALTDEEANFLQNFIYALMYAVDEHYHRQIHRHHMHKLDVLKPDCQLACEDLDDPPF